MCPGVSDFVDATRHRVYLAEHGNEFPFPIDGSEWSRLVSTRISHEHHCKCGEHLNSDFWVWLHSQSGPLHHERRTFQRALHHWFLLGADSYGLPWFYHVGEETKQQLACKTLYDLVKGKGIKDLAAFEADWVKGGSAAKVRISKTGEPWIGGDSEDWEPRPIASIKMGSHSDESREIESLVKTDGKVPYISADDLESIAAEHNGRDGIIYLPDALKRRKMITASD